jgi:CRP-like cAMP-binding protein
MLHGHDHSADALVRKLTAEFDLAADEQSAILALPLQVRSLSKGQDIVREGDRPSQCCLVLDGWACRYKMLDEGTRQIVAYQIAGDFTDLQSLHLEIMDHNVGTLVPCIVAFVPHVVLHSLIKAHPRIGAAFWRETLVDASITREWVVNIGGRVAECRVAHLFCEMFTRLRVVGRTDGFRFAFPLSQAVLAESTGMSTVHINRVVQALRRAGLIALQNGTFDVKDWEGLMAAGQFDASYMHAQPSTH